MRVRALSAVAAVALLCAAGPFARAAEVGKPAPDFTLTDHNGKAVKLSDHAGKVVVLEWFNEGCPFVKKQYVNGAMNETAKKYADKGVVWLAVNSTNSATMASNAKIAKEWKIDRPILDDKSGTVGRLYGAATTPHMYVVDAKGMLVYHGAIDSVPSADPDDISGATNHVSAALEDVMAGKAVSKSETKPYGCTVKYAKS